MPIHPKGFSGFLAGVNGEQFVPVGGVARGHHLPAHRPLRPGLHPRQAKPDGVDPVALLDPLDQSELLYHLCLMTRCSRKPGSVPHLKCSGNDTPAELELLNQVRELDRGFTNYLLPQQKLVKRTRNGAKVTEVQYLPATPHQRAVDHPKTRKMPAICMNAVFKKLRVMALSRRVLVLAGQLEILAKAKGGAATNRLKEAPS